MDQPKAAKLKLKIKLSQKEGKEYQALFNKYSIKNEKTGQKKRIQSSVVTRLLSCSTNLDPTILYAIWERVVQENQSEIQESVEIELLKESQFYMACKLVAIYQKSIQENTLDELLPQKIDEAITTANKYNAVFDFQKFENAAVNKSEGDAADARLMVQPQEDGGEKQHILGQHIVDSFCDADIAHFGSSQGGSPPDHERLENQDFSRESQQHVQQIEEDVDKFDDSEPLEMPVSSAKYQNHSLTTLQSAQPNLASLMPAREDSEGSNYSDSTLDDLHKDNFSISITGTSKVSDEQPGSSYLSYFAPASQFVMFKIQTKSKLPMYDSVNKLHVVNRRFSDFEYLLKQLQGKPENSGLCFSPLSEKRVFNNLDDAFIHQRRLELEGFLRVLVQMEDQIKTDMDLKVFLTFEDAKYKSYRQDPSPILDNLAKIYAYVPNMPSRRNIIEVNGQGVTKTVKQAIKRAKHELKGIDEPQELIKDSGGIDFDLLQQNVDKNIQILSDCQSEHEVHQSLFSNQMQQSNQIMDTMADIQKLMIKEFQERAPDLIKNINVQIQDQKENQIKREKQNAFSYQQSKSLKQIQEIVTISRAVSASISERKSKVKEFVLLTERKNTKQKELADPKTSLPLMEKKKANDEIYEMCRQIQKIKDEIKNKYNSSIIKQASTLESQHKQKIVKFVQALGKSQKQLYSLPV